MVLLGCKALAGFDNALYTLSEPRHAVNQPQVMDRLQRGGIVPGAVLEFGVRGANLVAVDGATTTELSSDIAHGIHVRPAA